jgi:hypothetical protein
MNDFLSIVTAANRPVKADSDKGILYDAVFATTGLASDGWIVLPSGISLSRYAGNAIVTCRHIARSQPDADSSRKPIVIANAINLRRGEMELIADVQFAKTQEGQEWGYLYGVNPENQAFMRAWSVEGDILSRSNVDWNKARMLSGQYWDENLAEKIQRSQRQVNVATGFELSLVAAVSLGADRCALTRAAQDGIRLADDLIARIDLRTASEELAGLKTKLSETDARIGKLDGALRAMEGDIQALRSDGASAAARGNSEAILLEVRSLRRLVNPNQDLTTKGT